MIKPGRSEHRIALVIGIVCAAGVLLTANAFLTSSGKLAVTKMKENPFDAGPLTRAQGPSTAPPPFVPPR